jgi:hypothetical protein
MVGFFALQPRKLGQAVARRVLSSYFAEPNLEGSMRVFPSTKRVWVVVAIVAAGLAGAVMRPLPAAADGAIAVAQPDDVVKKGFAYGFATGYADVNHAEAEALSKCRETTINAVRPLCAVAQDFKNQCVAVAMDPQAGTPGVGWGIGDDLHTAEATALAGCEQTAGPGRRAACKVDRSGCDGSAK